MCKGLITKEKILIALKQSKSGRFPDNDGLCAEFYKTFWHIVSDELTEVTNCFYRNNTLSHSQKRGMINCLFKRETRKTWQTGDQLVF